MKIVVSKHVTALYPGGGLLEDDYFRRIRERIFQTTPYKVKEDTNRPKKTIINTPGLGSNDRGHNPGAGIGLGRDPNESKDKSISSGYNDGEQANDEIGPGFTPTKPNPYAPQTMLNELFMDLEMKDSGRDSIQKNIDKILKGPSVVTPHRRFSVK